MGQNYLRTLLALGFQAFLIIICVAIYAVLVQGIAAQADVSAAMWSCMGYTVLLCFALFKTGSLSKASFSARTDSRGGISIAYVPVPKDLTKGQVQNRIQPHQAAAALLWGGCPWWACRCTFCSGFPWGRRQPPW